MPAVIDIDKVTTGKEAERLLDDLERETRAETERTASGRRYFLEGVDHDTALAELLFVLNRLSATWTQHLKVRPLEPPVFISARDVRPAGLSEGAIGFVVKLSHGRAGYAWIGQAAAERVEVLNSEWVADWLSRCIERRGEDEVERDLLSPRGLTIYLEP
jgi:hypothetical protein